MQMLDSLATIGSLPSEFWTTDVIRQRIHSTTSETTMLVEIGRGSLINLGLPRTVNGGGDAPIGQSFVININYMFDEVLSSSVEDN